MKEIDGKFYLMLEFVDREYAAAFEEGMNNGGNIWASKAQVVDEAPSVVQNTNNAPVTGTLAQIGQVSGRIDVGGKRVGGDRNYPGMF